ncbi:MAG: alpha/beta fold hydrolase [Candidatus Auribacterota bacterium]|jgi:pimeloyl-ACP methyl ester carboxylesterase|nr:alpha/beta fold hydrolase [Candidatus Auribacterota bacterium]
MKFLIGILFVLIFLTVVLYLLVVRLVAKIFLNIAITTARESSPEFPGEHVSFKTRDGLTLEGYFINGKRSRGKTVVFCHEVGAGWGSWHKYASFLPGAGYNLFSFDFRGHGATAGTNGYSPNQWISPYEIEDIIGAVEYLRARPEVDKNNISFFGISRGAGAAVCAAYEIKGIRAIIADSAFSTYETLIDYILRWTSIYLPFKRLPHWLNYMLAVHGMWLASFKIGHALPRMEKYLRKLDSVPVFFIHGDRDNYIPPDQAKRLYNMALEPKKLWIIAKARHNESVLVKPEQYREQILSFLNTYMD